MDLSTATYVGPPIDDWETFRRLPADYREFLDEANGAILFRGGLHIRGCVLAPDWHSLGHAWSGEDSLAALYPSVEPGDVPFAQDCFGDSSCSARIRCGGSAERRARSRTSA